MKRGIWSIALKKQTALILHLLFLCLSFVGVTFIIYNENFDRGLGWIREETYADTSPFTLQLEEDAEKIFQYVQYKDLFEIDGDLNYDAAMFCVTHNSGNSKIYTLNEAISYARRLGYYLNENYEVAGGPDVHERESGASAMPMIEWKAYNPNEVYKGPGDAFSTLEDLSVQVLTVLGEYYQIRYNYIDRPSNLYFRVSYADDSGSESVYTNAENLSDDDLRNMGRYLYMSGDSLFVDTNLKYIPENVISLLSTNNQYDNSDYYILLGVDVNYPYDDPYSEAHKAYVRIRNEYISGTILTLIGAAGLLATLFAMARLTGHTDASRSGIELYYFDHLPLECMIVVYFIFLWLAVRLTGQIMPRAARLIVSQPYQDYTVRSAQRIACYLVTLGIALSFLRNYKARNIWKGSLLCRALSRVLPALAGMPVRARFTLEFIGYLFCSGALAGACFYLYRQKWNIGLPYLYLVPLFILIGFQIWVYLLLCRGHAENSRISEGIFKISAGDTSYKIDTRGFSEPAERVGNALNTLGDGLETAIQEQVKSERLKADLITNVSHDIKTPLTSIINYVDLLKREKIQDPKIQGYLDVLDQKSQRLKTLTEDLVEASKASSGNLKLEISDIDFVELIQQSNGEFEERFAQRRLTLVSNLPDEDIIIAADGRRLWRVIENLYNNAFKYAMEQSRVYADMVKKDGYVYFTIKNVSASPLNINADELTERFVRGDVARTTEGSGLGLSIAKSLTQLQGGTFEIYIDGDLFKAQVGFPVKEEGEPSRGDAS